MRSQIGAESSVIELTNECIECFFNRFLGSTDDSDRINRFRAIVDFPRDFGFAGDEVSLELVLTDAAHVERTDVEKALGLFCGNDTRVIAVMRGIIETVAKRGFEVFDLFAADRELIGDRGVVDREVSHIGGLQGHWLGLEFGNGTGIE